MHLAQISFIIMQKLITSSPLQTLRAATLQAAETERRDKALIRLSRLAAV